MSGIFIVVWLLSGLFSVLVGVGIITYIRRTWQQIRLDSDNPRHDQLLDGIDQLQTQLYLVNERLRKMEEELAGGTLPPPSESHSPGAISESSAESEGEDVE